jgi:hypothetical protein
MKRSNLTFYPILTIQLGLLLVKMAIALTLLKAYLGFCYDFPEKRELSLLHIAFSLRLTFTCIFNQCLLSKSDLNTNF